jgi:hypothetical protein
MNDRATRRLTVRLIAAVVMFSCLQATSAENVPNVTPKNPVPEKYPSPVPRQVFSGTLAEQEQELKANVLMLRFAESRKKLAADPYRPAYHFVSPESQMNDPNGLRSACVPKVQERESYR